MTALHSIERDIARAAAEKGCEKSALTVLVGASAEHSILATTGDKTLPETIDGVPVERTSEFAGYAVVKL